MSLEGELHKTAPDSSGDVGDSVLH